MSMIAFLLMIFSLTFQADSNQSDLGTTYNPNSDTNVLMAPAEWDEDEN